MTIPTINPSPIFSNEIEPALNAALRTIGSARAALETFTLSPSSPSDSLRLAHLKEETVAMVAAVAALDTAVKAFQAEVVKA